jgi:hypothetical protein
VQLTNQLAKIKVSFVAGLLLVSCGQSSELNSKFSDAERDEIGDIAGDIAGEAIAADGKIRELEEKIEADEDQIQELESRIAEIEQQLSM